MRAGDLFCRVEFQEDQGATQDAYGAPTPGWKTIARRWASFEPLVGRELETARAQAATVTHRVKVRHWADLRPWHRVKFGDRLFSIDSVTNTGESDRETVLLCTEAAQTE